MNALGRIGRQAPDPALVELVKALARAAARRDAAADVANRKGAHP